AKGPTAKGPSNANIAGQQNSALGQNNSQAQFEGLNVGPGALFPIGQGNTVPGESGQGNRQGYAPPSYSGNNAPNPQFGESNAGSRMTLAPRPGAQAPPANPLATYENQLRQLDNQYNNTLQQLDRNATGAIPRAQY
ncbi:MAG: hypothetical protein O2856_02870, partial [Planctomycetota bacterium]|nr:hypothetical protein [Planctomycetota bacterium]